MRPLGGEQTQLLIRTQKNFLLSYFEPQDAEAVPASTLISIDTFFNSIKNKTQILS